MITLYSWILKDANHHIFQTAYDDFNTPYTVKQSGVIKPLGTDFEYKIKHVYPLAEDEYRVEGYKTKQINVSDLEQIRF